MSTDNIVTHPAFERAPVVNPKTRGRPRGTASFRTARRRKVMAQFHAARDRAITKAIASGAYEVPNAKKTSTEVDDIYEQCVALYPSLQLMLIAINRIFEEHAGRQL